MRAAEPLAIEGAFVAGSTNGFNLRFNRPVNPHTATNLANYQLSQGVPICAITLDMDEANFACRIRDHFSEASTDPLLTAERPTLELVSDAG